MQGKPGGKRPAKPTEDRTTAAVRKKTAAAMATKPPAKTGVKAATTAMTFYLLPEEHKRLRHLALSLDTSAQELILEGLDHVFGKHGEPAVKRHPGTRTRKT